MSHHDVSRVMCAAYMDLVIHAGLSSFSSCLCRPVWLQLPSLEAAASGRPRERARNLFFFVCVLSRRCGLMLRAPRGGVEGQQECLSGPCGWEASVGVVLSQLSPLVVDTPCCHVRHGEEM